jgi:hypothetical protein
MMARGPLTFKQRDLTRAIRAALAAGLKVERAYIEVDGRIMLGFAKPNGKLDDEPIAEQKEIIL